MFENEKVSLSDEIKKYIDIVGLLYVMLDERGKIILVNKTACKVLGYLEEEMLGKNWFDLAIPEETRNKVKKVFDQLMKGEVENVEYYENEISIKEGEKKLISWHNSIRFDSKGKIIGIISAGEDITEQRNRQEKLQKLQLGLNRIDEAVFVTNKDGIFEYINLAFEKMYGYSFEECKGKTPRIIKSGKLDQNFYEQFWNDLLANKTVNTDLVNKTKEGKLIEVSISVGSISNKEGDILGFLATQRDVTKERENELQLKNQYDLMIYLSKVKKADELIQKGLSKALEIAGVEVGGLYLFDDYGNLNLMYSEGLSEEFVKAKSHYEKNSKSIEMVQRGSPIYVDYKELSMSKDEVACKEGLEEVGIIPIKYEEEVLGAINVATKDGSKISDLAKKSLEMVVIQIGLLLVSKRAEERLREKMSDLERINKLMVGRELKMAEMKRKISLLNTSSDERKNEDI